MITLTDFETIPDELQERDQWLYWNASNDTPRAPLASPAASSGASWSDPEEWLSFETAAKNAAMVPNAGIGYVNAINNDDYARGLIGSIDIDGAADEDGHARDWVPSLDPFLDRDAYSEWSPSDQGVRIPVIGLEVPDWWTDQHFSDEEHRGVEVLTNKFSTYTGNQMRGAGDEVVEYGDWLDDWLREVYKVITGEDPLADQPADADDLETGGAGVRDFDGDDWLTKDIAEEALDHINPDVNYPAWKDIGMALANHFGESTGKRLFTNWSRGGSKWDSDAKDQAKRIVNDANSYNYDAATLVHHAQNHGWDASEAAREQLSTRSDGGATAVPPSSDDAPTADGGDAESGPESDTDVGEWESIRMRLRQAENSDERAGPRFDAAMKLHRDQDWANLQENDVLWRYQPDTGIYDDDGKQFVRTKLTNHLEDQYRGQTLSVCMDHIRGRNTVTQERMGGPPGLIAARNCVIDLHKEAAKDHSPEYMFQSRLGAEFDPGADCPEWRAFLDDVVPNGTQRRKLQEFVGYCLHHWGLPYHKALFLVGPTASGKSTFLDTINELLGGDTVASLTPQQLTTQRFAPAELYGKWANIRNDIPKETVSNTGMFKELIAGDPMKAEKKRKDPFFFNPTAKHLFSANQLPEMEVDDEAFFRRILLIPFPETVPKSERDNHLGDRLEDELPGILNWAVEGLQRLLGNGTFTGDQTPGRTRETWSKWGDSVERFDNVALTDGDDAIPKSMVYAAYLQFCREQSIPTDTQNQMTRQLKREGHQDGRQYVDGKQQRCFVNVAWTGRGEELLDAAKSDDPEDAGSGSATGIDSF